METNIENTSNFKIRDGGWGWVVLFSSFFIHFIMDGIINSIGGIYLNILKDEFKVSLSQISLIFSLLPATTLLIGN